jgi:RNA polymerase-binding protein DksA
MGLPRHSRGELERSGGDTVAKKLAQKKSAARKPVKPSKPAVRAVSKSAPAALKRSAVKVAAAPVKPSKPMRAGKAEKPKNFNNLPPPLAPVPTDGKPRKNQAGMNARELEHFRELLLAKRRELVGDMSSMEREALRSASGSNLSNLPLHMADMGTDNYEQEFTLGLVEKDRNLLREINQALAKIQDGSYGICEGTGKPISKARLEAQPWARFSIEHARKMERGFIR